MRKIITYQILLLLFSSLLFFNACDNAPGSKSAGTLNVNQLPNSSGSAGEVLVVMDNYNWKNNAGDLMRKTLEQEFPALTQPEPIFDVVHITEGAFDDIFTFHRTIIQVDIDPEIKEASLKYGENIWAKPQLVIKLEAPDSYSLETLIEKEQNNILKSIRDYDRKRLQDVYKSSTDLEIKDLLTKYNIKMFVPRGYNVDFSNNEFTSISIETPKTSQVIFVYEYPLKGINTMQTSRIIEKRNAFLKKYTKGTRENSYITTAEIFPPITYDIRIKGREIVEVRGWWELHNGFMGGPFISHSIVDKKRNKVVVADAYVYYPNNKKRNIIRQLEAIIYSMDLLEK